MAVPTIALPEARDALSRAAGRFAGLLRSLPDADLLTASGMFGTRIDTGPGAPDDVRLLALLGRRA
jgi:hypothetical protein